MSRQPERSSPEYSTSLLVSCCAILGIAQYILYSVNFNRFFQGDAIFWMYYRFHSLGDFLRALGTLDIAHWYRPLSNRTIPALFYPFWGLEPYGYHLVVFLCFFAVSCLVFLFLLYLTRKISVAFPAAFYFSIHSSNVYTTYDFAFAPELFYVFFYVSSVWLYLEGERRASLKWRLASAVAFVLSLMSKEAAVTLPAMLVLAHLTFVEEGRRGLVRAFRAIGLHVAVWIAYLTYIAGYLKVGGSDYMLSLGGNVLRNVLTAFYYAFNLRRDGWMPTRAVTTPILLFLVIFALLQVALALWLLFRKDRRVVAFGLLWFVVASAPMLMLNNTPGPYYLFLAMVGFSLVIGMNFNAVHERLRARESPRVSYARMGVLLLMIWLSCRSMIATDTARDTALGYASTWAENSMVDMLKARPKLQPGSNVYILDQSMPDLWRFQGLGNLFKLVYGDDSIKTSYRSTGQTPAGENGELVVMKAEAGRLLDVTAEFRQSPEKFLVGIDESSIEYIARPGVMLSVTPREVVAGRDFYWLAVSDLGSPDVVVQYTVNDGPVAEGTFRLNAEGKVRFFVSELTPVGLFRFLRFRTASASNQEWFRAEATLRVLPPGSP